MDEHLPAGKPDDGLEGVKDALAWLNDVSSGFTDSLDEIQQSISWLDDAAADLRRWTCGCTTILSAEEGLKVHCDKPGCGQAFTER
jgi:hypothetical protein